MPSTSHQRELSARPHLAGPLYHQIQSLLRERIHAGEWLDSQCMPTEIGLAREYGVSIGTMRKALEKLEHSRLIVRKQGLGTFVNSSRIQSGHKFSRWLAYGSPKGETPVETLHLSVDDPTPDEAERLKLPEGSKVLRVDSVSFLEKYGAIFDKYTILQARLERYATAAESTAENPATIVSLILAQAVRCIDSITAEHADDETANALDIQVGSPLLRIERSAFDVEERPVFLCSRRANLRGAEYLVDVN